MNSLFFIFALITLAFSQNLGNARPGCTLSFNGTIYGLSSTWYKYTSTDGEWIFNPCDSSVEENDEELDGMPAQAGAYFAQDDIVYNRGYANDAIWNLELVDQVPESLKITMVNPVANQANPACTTQNYYTHVYFFCGDIDAEPSVTMIDETDCEAWFEVITEDACSADLPEVRQRRVFMVMTAPLFVTIACASLLCCCICARRRRQAKILNSNFSNVAFQPIPSAHIPESRVNNVQPMHVPQFARPNHIQVPRTYFFSEQTQPIFQNNGYVIPLEDFQKQNQMASDEQLAREIHNQLNQ